MSRVLPSFADVFSVKMFTNLFAVRTATLLWEKRHLRLLKALTCFSSFLAEFHSHDMTKREGASCSGHAAWFGL